MSMPPPTMPASGISAAAMIASVLPRASRAQRGRGSRVRALARRCALATASPRCPCPVPTCRSRNSVHKRRPKARAWLTAAYTALVTDVSHAAIRNATLALSYAPGRRACRAGGAARARRRAGRDRCARTREPMVGQMRLTWWHDAADAARRGAAARRAGAAGAGARRCCRACRSVRWRRWSTAGRHCSTQPLDDARDGAIRARRAAAGCSTRPAAVLGARAIRGCGRRRGLGAGRSGAAT